MMNGEYWFNTEPISKNVDIIFEFGSYQFINEVLHLCSIDEIKDIIKAVKKHIEDKWSYTFSKEYITIFVAFSVCRIEYELPTQSYECYLECMELIEMLEEYVAAYERLDDWFKSF